MAATPYAILTFGGCGTNVLDCERLKAAVDRLHSTTVLTSIRPPTELRRHRFFWMDQWRETVDLHGCACGIELILPDPYYTGVLDEGLVLTIDRTHFDLTGRIERWLYRLVRKHGRRQAGGSGCDFVHLQAMSGSLFQLKHFAYDRRRQIVHRQTLPRYVVIIRDSHGVERLGFAPIQLSPNAERPRRRGHISQLGQSGLNRIALSGPRALMRSVTGASCHRGQNSLLTFYRAIAFRARKSAKFEFFGFLLTDQGFSSPIGNATVATPAQRPLSTFHQNRFAAANLVATVLRRLSGVWGGQETSLNRGDVI